jgi:hypothetical protein
LRLSLSGVRRIATPVFRMARKPRLGEASLSALIGAVIGAVTGLVAVGIPLAIAERNFALIFTVRTLGIVGLLISAPAGWVLGGQLGPRFQNLLGARNGEIAGGIIGGLIPFALIFIWAWRMMH